MVEIHYCTAVTLYFIGVVQGVQTAVCVCLCERDVDRDRERIRGRDTGCESESSELNN